MWRSSGALASASVALLLVAATLAASGTDPSTLPRLALSDLVYTGAFRLPDATVNGDSFSIGGRPFAYNPARNSLFVGTRSGRLAEVSIPVPVNSASIASLPFAGFLQGFVEPTEGQLSQIASDGVSIDGLMVYGDRLYGSASIYYDANNTQRASHYSRSTTLTTPGVVGMAQVWESGMTGFVAGYMAPIPPEWRERLGGAALTGQCCLPIAWRTSWGPAAFAWDPADLGAVSPVPATPLVYYPGEHHTLGHWDGSGSAYGGTTQINGVAIIAGTRTALFVGRNGLGPFCYGNGTSDQSLVGTTGPDNEEYCYDPSSPAKGQHAYPYVYQIWAYDLNDLADVRAGRKAPWDVVPYGIWPLALPTPEPEVHIGGVGYDASRQVLYVSQLLADKDGYGYRPIIHVFAIGAPATTPIPPPPAPEPAPAPSSRVSAVALAADKIAPQIPGTAITWTATPAGGAAPHEYKWWTFDGAAWTPIGGWTTAATWTWRPAVANTASRVAVWARSAGNTVDDQEASVAVSFPIAGTLAVTPPPVVPSSSRATAVSITPNMVAPQPAGTTVTWTATPVGGVAPHQYKWWTFDGSAWTPVSDWTSGTFAWTPATANPAYRMAVWVRSAGNTVDDQEASTAVDFAITIAAASPIVTPPAPPPVVTPSTRATSVSLRANLAAPQPAHTTIAWVAVPIGGVAPHQYKWWTFDGSAWTPIGGWTTSQTWSWTPTAANSQARVAVWVRSAGNTVDDQETSVAMSFPISAAAGGSTRATAVTISANLVAPQARGTDVIWTATPVGGVAPQQYKWFVWDGSTWIVVRGWGTSNTFVWRPLTANAYYRVAVWVRSATSSTDDQEASVAVSFPITQ